MALIEPFMQKVVEGTTAIELEAAAGESLRVTDVHIEANSASYVTFRVDLTTVGYFRVGGQLGNHLAFPFGATKHSHDWQTSATAAGDISSFAGLKNAAGTEIASKMIGNLAASTTYGKVGVLCEAPSRRRGTLLHYLREKGIFKGYPIPEGKKFTISPAGGANGRTVITYEKYAAGDIKSTDENGPDAKTFFYISYGNAGGNINVNGESLLNTCVNPPEFPDFPFGKICPAKLDVELLGVVASDFAPSENDGTDSIYTKALKFTRERKVLFDPDRVGLRMENAVTTVNGGVDLVGEGYSVIGNYSDIDEREPFMLPQVLKFTSGEEFLLHWNTVKANSGQNIAVAEHEVGLILRAIKTG